jgi:hypothetical protein
MVQKLVEDNHQQLFVGVDEYDAPANAWLFSPEVREEQKSTTSSNSGTSFEKIAEVFHNRFFSVLKKAMGGPVMKYWLTGVLPVFRDGISPLTAVTPIWTWSNYNGLCGLTGNEVRVIAKAYLGDFPDLEKHLDEMKRWFDGYRFFSSGVKAPTLYNPQEVFIHLESFRANDQCVAISEEINATHSSMVLDALDGVELLPDFFMAAHSNRLPNLIKKSIGPRELVLKHDEQLTRTLLYYFGVLTFNSEMNTLCLPNRTMKRLVSSEFPEISMTISQS